MKPRAPQRERYAVVAEENDSRGTESRSAVVTEVHVALLRGINVGTAKRIAMADLRALIEGLGYRGVRTLPNSGNVVLSPPNESRRVDADELERVIAKKLGVVTRVTVLTAKEVMTAVRQNPFAKVAKDASRLLVLASRKASVQDLLKPLLKERWAPEALALGSRVAYLCCADGVADS